MKTRVLLCAAISLAVLFSTWLFFFFGLPISEFTLEFLGDALDVVHPPLHYNLSSAATDTVHKETVFPNPYGTVILPADIPKLPPWEPYYDRNLDLFGNTYVVSLPNRIDRRISMERLRQAISANWIYVNAVAAEDPKISWLMACIRSVREGRATSEFSAEEFAWPEDFGSTGPRLANGTLDLHQMQSWCPKPDDDNSAEVGLSQSAHDDSRQADLSPELRPLTCATRNLTDGPPYTAALPPYMILTPAKVACWTSHLQILERFAHEQKTVDSVDSNSPNDVALIMEDDVDMERDIRERLRYVWDHLPEGWDLLFLGHCWSNESYHPAIATLSVHDSNRRSTILHPSFAPKCTHAYAVTRPGALKLVQHLQHPPFAYSRALDQAFSWLILSGRVKSYSVVPSPVVQRKMSWSDIDAGESGLGSDWRESLDNGILAA